MILRRLGSVFVTCECERALVVGCVVIKKTSEGSTQQSAHLVVKLERLRARLRPPAEDGSRLWLLVDQAH